MLKYYLTRIASLPRAGGARAEPRLVPPLPAPPGQQQDQGPVQVERKPQTDRQKAVARALDHCEMALLNPYKTYGKQGECDR